MLVLGLVFLAVFLVGFGGLIVGAVKDARMYRDASPESLRDQTSSDDRSPAERGADIAATFAWRRR